MAPLAAKVVKEVPGSRSVALKYPASMDPTYERSVASGEVSMTKYIASFVEQCPNSKFVLMGYSQVRQLAFSFTSRC